MIKEKQFETNFKSVYCYAMQSGNCSCTSKVLHLYLCPVISLRHYAPLHLCLLACKSCTFLAACLCFVLVSLLMYRWDLFLGVEYRC